MKGKILTAVLACLLAVSVCTGLYWYRKSWSVTNDLTSRILSDAYLLQQVTETFLQRREQGESLSNDDVAYASKIAETLNDKIQMYNVLYPKDILKLEQLALDYQITLQNMRFGTDETKGRALTLQGELNQYLHLYVDSSTMPGRSVLLRLDAAAAEAMKDGYDQLHLNILALH